MSWKTKIILALLAFAFIFCHRTSRAIDSYPLEQEVAFVRTNLASAAFESTRLTRDDYLKVISGIVKYFRHFQDEKGAIIDPFLQKEFQYSTPCYAWAATALIVGANETNLVESAASALDCALEQLAEDKAAMNHGDFFTFPAVLAYEQLRDRVTPERRALWETFLQKMKPQRCYNDLLRENGGVVHNWNVVALSGEFLRSQNGFTDLSFVEKYLEVQLLHFTAAGQYRDPNVPMAYDHFPRHFLATILERGYEGKCKELLEELLERAAWTSLLIQSPCGELPTGGRSAQHQWNEAEQCVTYEIWANRKQRAGEEVDARAFKRAAHLALQSMQRWIRPSGELWIVKNRFDPALRRGFQSYSSHSQYNLLAASMLSTAWLFADKNISEGACPADVGGFVFSLPEFHKIFANTGGLYLEIDTGADPEYNSTGLIRVHKTGVEPLIGPTDSAPISAQPLALGVAWRESGEWKSLAGCASGKIQSAGLRVVKTGPGMVKFSVTYEVKQPLVQEVVETYEVTPEQIRVTADVHGSVTKLKINFPVLVLDGERVPEIDLNGSAATVTLNGSRQNFLVETEREIHLRRSGKLIPCRNGFLEAIEAKIPGKRAQYTIRPGRLAVVDRTKTLSFDVHQGQPAPHH